MLSHYIRYGIVCSPPSWCCINQVWFLNIVVFGLYLIELMFDNLPERRGVSCQSYRIWFLNVSWTMQLFSGLTRKIPLSTCHLATLKPIFCPPPLQTWEGFFIDGRSLFFNWKGHVWKKKLGFLHKASS